VLKLPSAIELLPSAVLLIPTANALFPQAVEKPLPASLGAEEGAAPLLAHSVAGTGMDMKAAIKTQKNGLTVHIQDISSSCW